MGRAVGRPERRELAAGLEISRVVTGLWQVADMEREAAPLDPERGADALAEYAAAGFDTFDMADHYGSAELIAGRLLARGGAAADGAFTKWCPTPGPMTAEAVRAGVARSLDRLGVDRIDLLQFHWWTFEHPAYLDAMRELRRLREEGRIAHLGVTNFDTDHLRVLVGDGIEIASNQVCFSLLDRRAAEDMSAFCREHGIGLLAYGTLGGGFLTDRWLGAPEPARRPRLEQDEVQALHRRGRRLGGGAGSPRRPRRGGREARASRSPTSRRAGCWSSRPWRR